MVGVSDLVPRRHQVCQALFAALSGDETANPPLWQLLAVIPATILTVAALTAIPVHLGSRRPLAQTLQAEFA